MDVSNKMKQQDFVILAISNTLLQMEDNVIFVMKTVNSATRQKDQATLISLILNVRSVPMAIL